MSSLSQILDQLTSHGLRAIIDQNEIECDDRRSLKSLRSAILKSEQNPAQLLSSLTLADLKGIASDLGTHVSGRKESVIAALLADEFGLSDDVGIGNLPEKKRKVPKTEYQTQLEREIVTFVLDCLHITALKDLIDRGGITVPDRRSRTLMETTLSEIYHNTGTLIDDLPRWQLSELAEKFNLSKHGSADQIAHRLTEFLGTEAFIKFLQASISELEVDSEVYMESSRESDGASVTSLDNNQVRSDISPKISEIIVEDLPESEESPIFRSFQSYCYARIRENYLTKLKGETKLCLFCKHEHPHDWLRDTEHKISYFICVFLKHSETAVVSSEKDGAALKYIPLGEFMSTYPDVPKSKFVAALRRTPLLERILRTVWQNTSVTIKLLPIPSVSIDIKK